MLTPEQIAALGDIAGGIADPINDFLIKDAARRVAGAGQLTSTASYQIWRAQQLGLSRKQIEKRIQEELIVGKRKLKELLTQSAKVGYNFDLSRFSGRAVPFGANSSVQQTVAAAVKLAGGDFTNLTQTLGMVGPDGRAYPLQKAYQKSMDYAFEQVFTGATDYNTAIRTATKNLADKGVRVIDYESGVHTGLETAVRRNVMGGLGLMEEEISQRNHDDLGADGWEISAHAASAPDHEPIQGKQYGDADYTALNDSLKRRIGTLNCGHAAFPILLGINSPQYTDEELRRFREDNEAGVTIDGRHYTMYEATQMQRKLETAMRHEKNRILVAEGTGDKDNLTAAQIRLQRLRDEYGRFSKAAGLSTQQERAQVAGFGRGQAARATAAAKAEIAKYSAVRYNKDGTIVVTDDWKAKGKTSPPRVFRPNAVLETQTVFRNGKIQIDRTLYDSHGIMRTQIHPGPHNRPDLHKLGKSGEHAHDYTWDASGKRKSRIDRDLSESEHTTHADLLGEETENER